MANILKQIKVGDTTYNIEPYTNYLPLTGGSITGELKLYASSGDSPRLTFQRGELTDSYNDWSIYDSGGYLYIQQRGGGSTAWETRGAIDQYGVNFVGTISEDGTLLANKYVTIGTSQTISGLKTFKGNESNDISFVYNGNKTISGYGNHTAIRHALSFPWYNDIYQIGNIRGDSADSMGFGITKGNSELVARFVDTSNAYIGNNKIIHSGSFVSGNSSNGEHNANNAITNGHYYYSSNGPATSLGASYTDGALYVQSHSDAWAGQIAQDYRNGSLFVRGKNNGSWSSWKRIIDSGNIGSQSVNYANSAGSANSVALKDSSGTTTKATMQYNSTEDCIEFIFA